MATRYLAKYFHHSSTGASHQLLLILKEDSSAMCIFEDMATRDRYRCEDFKTWPDAIPLYRQEIVRLTDAGFFETVETNYTLSKLPAVPTSKPTWQQGLDELYLARLGNDTAGADDMIAVLSVTEAAATPFFLWLKAEHLFATVVNQDYTPALETCLAAEHGFLAIQASSSTMYHWSLWASDFQAMIYWRLHELYYYIGDHAASLVAIDMACEIGNNQERSSRLAWVQCTYFPQFQ